MTKVSVILPVLNGAPTLKRALDSLLTQTFRDFEILIVDDGSTDETPQIAEACAAQDSRCRLIRLDKNHGVSFARNKALAEAASPWIATLDADDWYEPQRLEKMLAMAEILQADAVIDNLFLYDHTTGQIAAETHFGPREKPELLTAEELFAKDTPFAKCAIGYARPLVRSSFLKERHLCYDERFRLGEDFLFLAEIVLRGGAVFTLPFASYVHVSRLSPSTGALSPFSRSLYDPSEIVRAARALLARYDDTDDEARRAMKRRLKLFTRLTQAHEVRKLWRARRQGAAVLSLLRHPFAVIFGAELFLRRWFK